MANNTVQFTINLNGNAISGVAKLDQGVGKLDAGMNRLRGTADKVNGAMDRIGKSAFRLNNILSVAGMVIGRVSSSMRAFTEANQAQQEAETKLARVMRNTMDASDDEIQSIKDLATAQQKLGVIGDEVQLAGAQELGTYLEKTDSLKKLMPVMNDMLAQQYGLNATQEQAVTIGSMMGKVMEGQTGALSRYGYKFTKAQEQLLKYGTEEQRVATLAEVVGESVGGMNEALAATPEGKLKQAQNRLGDIKETAGNIFNSMKMAALPALNVAMELLERIAARVKSLADRIAASPIAGKAAEALRMILDQLEGLSERLFSAFRPVLNVLVNAAGHFKQILDGTWGVIVNKVHPALEKVTQSIARIVAGVVDWITSSEITMDIFRQGWAIIGAVSDVIAFIFNVLEKVVNYVVIPIIRLIDMGYAKLKSIVDWLVGLVSKAGAWFAQKMHPVVEWFEKLQDFVRRIVDRISDWLGKLFNPLLKFWESISGNRMELIGGSNPAWGGGNTMGTLVQTVNAGIDAGGSGVGGLKETASKSATATATGGTRNTTININLGKMVESINFNGGYEENEQNMEDRLAEMLNRILGMAEATAG